MNILYMYSIKSTVAFIDEMVLGMYFIYPSSFVWRMITSSQSLWTNLPIAPYIDCSEQWYLSVFVHAMECKSASVYNTSTDHDGSNFFCNLLIPYPSTVLHSNRPMISGIMILPVMASGYCLTISLANFTTSSISLLWLFLLSLSLWSSSTSAIHFVTKPTLHHLTTYSY